MKIETGTMEMKLSDRRILKEFTTHDGKLISLENRAGHWYVVEGGEIKIFPLLGAAVRYLANRGYVTLSEKRGKKRK